MELGVVGGWSILCVHDSIHTVMWIGGAMNEYYLNPSQEHIRELPRENVLVCNFASGITTPSLYQELIAYKGKYRIATKRGFSNQVRECKTLVLNGGSSPLLIDTLNSIKGWQHYLKNKNVVAYSAGISALARYSFNFDINRVVQGLGIIPYNTIVHYDNSPHMKMGWSTLKLLFPFTQVLCIEDKDTYVFEE